MQQWQFINNFNQLSMFRTIVSPVLRSTRVCFLYSLWYSAPTMLQVGDRLVVCHQPAASSVHYTTSCTKKHNLVLLRTGETIVRNMLSWLKLLIKSLLHLVGCLYYCHWHHVTHINVRKLELLSWGTELVLHASDKLRYLIGKCMRQRRKSNKLFIF